MDEDYQRVLAEAIQTRRERIEKSELPTLKEDLRAFYNAYAVWYSLLLKKRLVKEDPYKQEVQIGEIQVPENTAFSEFKKDEQLSIRLSKYDTQLDVLVNFYQFNTTYFTLDRIKGVLGLMKYIEWMNLTKDSASPITQAVVELTNQLRHDADALELGGIVGSTQRLSRLNRSVLGTLKVIADFSREAYKLEVRNALGNSIPAGKTPSPAEIKLKMASAMPQQPFYTELINELIQEDYSPTGPELRENILKSLKVTEAPPQTANKEVSLKHFLVGGIQSINTTIPTLMEIGVKLDTNHHILEGRERSIWDKLIQLLNLLLNREPKPSIYEIHINSGAMSAREQVNFNQLRGRIDTKVKQFTSIQNMTIAKLSAIQEDKLIRFLEQAIKDLQALYKTLNGLDDYFKQTVDQEDRDRIKGIKPELSILKEAYLKANRLRSDYTSQKVEIEELKKLGITSTT
ncbi:MAG: hypothetical protein LBQ30_03455 [Treponema sp.]|jgi:hypothetical protein|nr:hypothetical protein [Treponema sp.]